MYQITITDYYGKKIKIEVSAAIFQVYEDKRLMEISEEHERREHVDKRGLENIYVLGEAARGMQSVEWAVFANERWEQFLAVLDDCSPLQKERYLLHVVYGYTCAEIAAAQKCSVHTIQRAIKRTSKKVEILKRVVGNGL